MYTRSKISKASMATQHLPMFSPGQVVCTLIVPRISRPVHASSVNTGYEQHSLARCVHIALAPLARLPALQAHLDV